MTSFNDLPYELVLAVTKFVADDKDVEKTLSYMACTSRTLRKSVAECVGEIHDAYDPLVTFHMAKVLMREVYDFRNVCRSVPSDKLEAAAVARGYTPSSSVTGKSITVSGHMFCKYVTPRVYVMFDPAWGSRTHVTASFLAFHQGTYKWVRVQIAGPGAWTPEFACLARVRNMLLTKTFTI